MTNSASSSMEVVSQCPACGADKLHRKYSGLKDFVENVPGQWSVDSCGGCGCLLANPRLRPDTVGTAYQSYYTHQSAVEASLGDNGSSYAWKLVNGYLNSRYGLSRSPVSRSGRSLVPVLFPLRQQLDFFMRHLPKSPGRLLDVGCGNGRFLLRAREAGWDVMGLEPDPLAVAAVRQAGIDVAEGFLDDFDSTEPFDVITASHVIEHTHYPKQFVKGMYDNLRPGGAVWLATPNANSIGHAWYGSSWRGLEPPRHMVVFSGQALRKMLDEAGFVDVEFKRRGRGARYILNMSKEIAARANGKSPTPLPVSLVDLAASVLPQAAEEIVVTARRPQ